MRGRMAAACAALLVGMSPAGALPFASFAAAVSCQVEGAAVQRHTGAKASRSAPVAALRLEPAVAVRRTAVAEKRAIWRSPSGPAPSRGPPAA